MKKILSIFLVLFLTVSLAACSPDENTIPVDPGTTPVEGTDEDIKDDDPIEEDEKEPEVEEEPEEEPQEEPEEEAKEKEADLYFANLSYVETGDESLDHLKSEKRMITYENTSFEEAIVRELLKGPQGEELTTGIPETLNLLSVKVEEDMATVDFASDGLSGASLQETLTIEQIVETLTNLESIEKVKFIVDGKEAESLMGHVTIDQPFEGK